MNGYRKITVFLSLVCKRIDYIDKNISNLNVDN